MHRIVHEPCIGRQRTLGSTTSMIVAEAAPCINPTDLCCIPHRENEARDALGIACCEAAGKKPSAMGLSSVVASVYG